MYALGYMYGAGAVYLGGWVCGITIAYISNRLKNGKNYNGTFLGLIVGATNGMILTAFMCLDILAYSKRRLKKIEENGGKLDKEEKNEIYRINANRHDFIIGAWVGFVIGLLFRIALLSVIGD